MFLLCRRKVRKKCSNTKDCNFLCFSVLHCDLIRPYSGRKDFSVIADRQIEIAIRRDLNIQYCTRLRPKVQYLCDGLQPCEICNASSEDQHDPLGSQEHFVRSSHPQEEQIHHPRALVIMPVHLHASLV